MKNKKITLICLVCGSPVVFELFFARVLPKEAYFCLLALWLFDLFFFPTFSSHQFVSPRILGESHSHQDPLLDIFCGLSQLSFFVHWLKIETANFTNSQL